MYRTSCSSPERERESCITGTHKYSSRGGQVRTSTVAEEVGAQTNACGTHAH